MVAPSMSSPNDRARGRVGKRSAAASRRARKNQRYLESAHAGVAGRGGDVGALREAPFQDSSRHRITVSTSHEGPGTEQCNILT
jgi:hypothetical protein